MSGFWQSATGGGCLRREIEREKVSPIGKVRLVGILDAWDRGDELARRNLLASLFDPDGSCLHE